MISPDPRKSASRAWTHTPISAWLASVPIVAVLRNDHCSWQQAASNCVEGNTSDFSEGTVSRSLRCVDCYWCDQRIKHRVRTISRVSGYYTLTCDRRCPEMCPSGRCDRTYGHCICVEPGLFGPKCDRPCPSFMFGINCESHCRCQEDFAVGCDPMVRSEPQLGTSKGTPGNAKCVAEILGDKNKEVRGSKWSKTHLKASLIPKFSRGPPNPIKRGNGQQNREGEKRGKVASWLSGDGRPW